MKRTFKEYHEKNPQIYRAFRAFTLKAIERGHKNFSAEFIFNVIRWETKVSGDDEYKLNNNFKAGYARLFMKDHPEHEGFFRTRERKIEVIKYTTDRQFARNLIAIQ